MRRSFHGISFALMFLLVVSCGKGAYDATATSPGLRCYFFFIADCPACKASFKPYDRLYHKFKGRGIEFYAILSDPYLNDSLTERLLDYYGLTVPITFDTTLSIAATYAVTTTPQFLLLNDSNEVLYSGSIDDEYYSFGKHRASVKHHYLKDAILQTLNGEKITIGHTDPIGCRINYEFKKELE